ncbi:MAG: hypothetical protein KDE47_04130, partial [Caldilineaceae bacterium]|nr:hypothetical protein [Caldilineaceae bacterium]
DLLPTAYTFLRAGYNVLMFDLRSHGESERGLCAGGLTEDQDVMGAVDYVFQRHQADGIATPQVGIIGFGLGAAAALAAAGREKGGANVIRVFSGDSAGGSGFLTIQPANVKRLRFIIAIQPAALSALLAGCIRQKVGPLGLVLIPLVDKICQWRGGYPLAATSLHKCVREVHVPVMYVQSRMDLYVAGDQVESLYNATPEPKQLCWIDPPGGRLEAYRYVAANMEDLLAFANQQISKS